MTLQYWNWLLMNASGIAPNAGAAVNRTSCATGRGAGGCGGGTNAAVASIAAVRPAAADERTCARMSPPIQVGTGDTGKPREKFSPLAIRYPPWAASIDIRRSSSVLVTT